MGCLEEEVQDKFPFWRDEESVLASVGPASSPERDSAPLTSQSKPRAAAPSHLCLGLPAGDRIFEERVGRSSPGPPALPAHPPRPADLLEARRPLAHECLGEALRVMRQVIGKHPLLNTVETLTAAGTLIAKVKGQPAARAARALPWTGFLRRVLEDG